ncbi:MAG TPA: hypothetical protein VFG22_10270 [Polyangiales bacterium]|nr:hypothetical protein [Polyangiales bacterium]
MNDANRWRPQKLRGGTVIQSGIDLRARQHSLDPKKRPFRALVLATRVVGEEGNLRNLSAECDLLLVRTNIQIMNVPVAQRQHGVNNVHDLWIPRASTRVLETNEGIPVATSSEELNFQSTHTRRGGELPVPTSLGRADGDMVLLDFIEGDIAWPIITHALTHERTNRVVRTGDGWREGSATERGNPKRDELYTHHYGAELRINELGDLLIDTVGAYSDPATEDESVSSGQVRIRVKDSQKLTVAMGDDEDVLEVWKDGSQLRIDLGEGADEKLVLGDTFKSYLDAELAKVNNFWSLLYNAHTHTVPMGGSSGPPASLQTETLSTMPDSALSDLAKTKKT